MYRVPMSLSNSQKSLNLFGHSGPCTRGGVPPNQYNAAPHPGAGWAALLPSSPNDFPQVSGGTFRKAPGWGPGVVSMKPVHVHVLGPPLSEGGIIDRYRGNGSSFVLHLSVTGPALALARRSARKVLARGALPRRGRGAAGGQLRRQQVHRDADGRRHGAELHVAPGVHAPY